MENFNGSKLRATSVVVRMDRRVEARKKIIITAGAVGSLQLLQLSGVGSASMLIRYLITVVLNLPAVGQNLLEHFAFFQVSKPRNSKRGLSLGHPELSGVAVLKANLMCIDWVVNTALPIEILEKALPEDRELLDVMRLDEAGRIYIPIMILHNSLAPSVPVDGSFVGTSVILMLPTPRGSLELSSASLNLLTKLTGDFFSIATDRAILVYEARRLLQYLTWTTIQDFVETEVSSSSELETLTGESSDKEIKDQIRVI
ncbi:hypothetical protein BTUL_0128g00430 [Botrytis tulipae]|uniref:Glucose-methanol-choline oxidoreductase N-terminal domain-containing protein n=1 Tax=Botrytis tulipae TaxID=87230 RepID=A0A4Z1ENT9_9HELO|nr:hypothetical protein BTUL_0128g00430 [Botrytis tulipae]